jgi:hypothetical protein
MTARLVAVGGKRAPFHTRHIQYGIGDPLWSPVPSHDFEVGEPDPSDYRKQQIETRLAEDDLL